jgi:hypothetical protein
MANRKTEAEKQEDELRESGEEEEEEAKKMKNGNIHSVYFAVTSH